MKSSVGESVIGVFILVIFILMFIFISIIIQASSSGGRSIRSPSDSSEPLQPPPRCRLRYPSWLPLFERSNPEELAGSSSR